MYLYSGGSLGSKNMVLYRALGKETEFMGMALLSSSKYSTLVKISPNFIYDIHIPWKRMITRTISFEMRKHIKNHEALSE